MSESRAMAMAYGSWMSGCGAVVVWSAVHASSSSAALAARRRQSALENGNPCLNALYLRFSASVASRRG